MAEIFKVVINVGAMAPYLIIVFAAMLWGQWLLQIHERNEQSSYHTDKKEMLHNLAANERMIGIYLAVGIGISGVFAGEGHSFWSDVSFSVIYAAVTPVLVIIALWVNDFFVLTGVNNTRAIREGNNAVALVELGGLIATGLMIKAAMMGNSDGVTVFIATIVYFLVGQVLMVLLVRLYEAFLSGLPIVAEVENGNVAAGIILGGKLVAYGLIMSTAIGGPSRGWIVDITSLAFTATAGMIFLYVLEWLADKFIVKWRTVAQILTPHGADLMVAKKNISAAVAHVGIKIAMASAIASIVV